jgi:hypothetical protein
MATSRRNSGLKFYLNGRRANDLHGLTGAAGNLLSAFDFATSRAAAGVKRRAGPATSRAVRAHYNLKAGDLVGKFRIESGLRGRRNDRDEFISVWASTRQLPLLAFGGRWSGRNSVGATAAITPGQGKAYDGAFIATVRGRRAIRVRKFDTSRGRRFARGPVQMLRGPSPFEMLSGLDQAPSRAVHAQVLSELTTFYSAELRRQWNLKRNRNG